MHPIPSLLAKKSPFCPGTNIPQEIQKKAPVALFVPGVLGWQLGRSNVERSGFAIFVSDVEL